MKINIIEHFAGEEITNITIEDRDSADIYDAMQIVERALLAVGYHPDSVRDGFLSKAEEYQNKIDRDEKERDDIEREDRENEERENEYKENKEALRRSTTTKKRTK